jgi:cell division septum initiation protein DivIVA
MSVWEPEGTSGPAMNSISEPGFAKVRHGYDPSQVSEHLKTVAGRTRILEDRVSELESELEQVRGQEQPSRPAEASVEDPYEVMSGRMAEVVRTLDQDVERMRQEAEAEAQQLVDEAKAEAARESREVEKLRKKAMAEADEMLAEATAEADRIRVDAQATAEDLRAEAERALEDAKEQADAALAELTDRRDALVAEMRTLHDRMLDSASRLEPIVDGERADDEVVVVEDGAAESDEESEAEGLVSPGR